jgi:hypothetical protein
MRKLNTAHTSLAPKGKSAWRGGGWVLQRKEKALQTVHIREQSFSFFTDIKVTSQWAQGNLFKATTPKHYGLLR